jgi:hypothetical protein
VTCAEKSGAEKGRKGKEKTAFLATFWQAILGFGETIRRYGAAKPEDTVEVKTIEAWLRPVA